MSELTLVVVCPRCGQPISVVPVDTTWHEAVLWCFIAAAEHECPDKPLPPPDV